MSEVSLSILMYHQVGEFAPMRAHRANYCSRRRFAAQMRFLALAGYRVLALDAALDALSGHRPLPRRAVVLTFDDAYENFAEHAWPILHQHGFAATVYAISDRVGQRAEWFAKDAGRAIPRLLDAPQLRALAAAGVAIGSHTCSHARLATLDAGHQWREIADSKSALEDLLGRPVVHFCYPFGSFDTTSVAAVARAGYRSATTCLRGAATCADHSLALPRKAISFGDDLLGYWWKLAVKNAPKPLLREWRQRLADEPLA